MRLIGLAVVLTLGFLRAPIAVEAQPPDKVYRIGVLERTSPAVNAANLESFRQGLRALGYVEGKNLVIEYRSAEGRDERFADLAAELVAAQGGPDPDERDARGSGGQERHAGDSGGHHRRR